MFIRVKDPDTGHEFDLPEGHLLIRQELVRPVKSDRYPPSVRPRRAKHHVKLAGQSAARTTPAPDGAGKATTKES